MSWRNVIELILAMGILGNWLSIKLKTIPTSLELDVFEEDGTKTKLVMPGHKQLLPQNWELVYFITIVVVVFVRG